jgi:hypothetical protein
LKWQWELFERFDNFPLLLIAPQAAIKKSKKESAKNVRAFFFISLFSSFFAGYWDRG